MAHPITIPRFGQTVEECTIVQWHKKVGDTVAEGDLLFEIETDKAVLEVESFYEGTLLKILVNAGQTEPVGTVAAFVGEPGEKLPDIVQPPARPSVAEPSPAPSVSAEPIQPETLAKSSVRPIQQPQSEQPGTNSTDRFRISPRASKLARDKVIDPTRIRGTGPGGRVVERDVIAYLEQRGYDRKKVTPTAKVLAAREGLDLLDIEGSGHGGKVIVEDVKRAAAEKPRPMSKMRRIIADRLTRSFTSTPHFYTTVSVDMTDLMEFRVELKAMDKRLTVTDFIMKSVVDALVEFPAVNSTTDGEFVRWNSHVHLGLAVAVENGLVVPAIRRAETLSIDEIHDVAGHLTEQARAGTLPPDEMTGSTFTVSNMGMMNIDSFTAIINPGESAILAVASTVDTPVVRNGEMCVRSIMKMTLSADHRLIDGATAARFVNAVKTELEDIGMWRTRIRI